MSTLVDEPYTAPAPFAGSWSPPPFRLLRGLLPVERGVVPQDRLEHHRRTYGVPPPPTVPRHDIVAVIEQSGLRGRGGAAFPTATKLRAVSASAAMSTNGRRPVVVINGTEGEPLSSKDDVLCWRAPQLLLDGALWAAASVGADEIRIALDRNHSRAVLAMDRALAERRTAGEGGPTVRVCPTPSRYVAGEENALVRFLSGGPAKPPGNRAPRPFEQGVDRRPTLVLNAETAGHLAQILQFGPAWFRSVGTLVHPGTGLATVTGAVGVPGVVEAPLGTPIADLARMCGGVTGIPQAVLVGGYYGSWLPPESFRLGWSDDGLAGSGARVGCGVVHLLPQGVCGLREVSRVVTWLAGQSAGQCGPCVHGLGSVAALAARLADGAGPPGSVAQLHRWGTQIDGRGGCRFPDGAIRFLRSALAVFAADVERHAAGFPCPGPTGVQYLLPIPDTGDEPWQ